MPAPAQERRTETLETPVGGPLEVVFVPVAIVEVLGVACQIVLEPARHRPRLHGQEGVGDLSAVEGGCDRGG